MSSMVKSIEITEQLDGSMLSLITVVERFKDPYPGWTKRVISVSRSSEPPLVLQEPWLQDGLIEFFGAVVLDGPPSI